MRTKYFSTAIILALIGTLNLTTGCAWWNKHILHKKDASSTPPPLGDSGGIGMSARGPIGEQIRGQFAAVHFDYDSAKVKPSEVSKLEAVASAMKSNHKNLIVEGHTDERGTAEYNRALGERRAQAAREELVRLGVPASGITTISYGKDHPIEPSHDDAAYSANRRAEFVLVNQ